MQDYKNVEEDILERNIKIRIQEIVNNKKLKSNHKSFKTGQKITISELEDINLNDYWKLNFEEEIVL